MDVCKYLDKLGIEYELFEHPAVFTCEEAERLCPKFESPDVKNLFLRNRKGDTHYLVVVEASKKIGLKWLSDEIGESTLSFASEERLQNILGLSPGSVSIFGLINDEKAQVKVLFDDQLWNAEKLHFHPNVNTATLELKKEGVAKFLDARKNEVRVLKFV